MSGGDRVRKGFAVKLVSGDHVIWTSGPDGFTVALPSSRGLFDAYGKALEAALKSYDRVISSGRIWRVRIVAIYSRPKRTAEQERADVVAWLRADGQTGAVLAHRISLGDHVGKADAK